MTEWHDSIVSAIRNREILTIFYDGEDRHIEPYAYGKSSEGHNLLRAYQTSGTAPDWHLFQVDQIVTLIHTGNTFVRVRDGYERNDSIMEEFYCQI
jgi:hypothetical protein